jgi:nucleotidyltransferase substrate binding protein (TIGR01987 family)
MKDLWEDQGVNNILGPRDAIQLSFQRGLIQNGEAWMYMMRSRNLTSHTYDEATAKRVVQDIRNTFTPLFDELALRLEQERVARKL